MRRFVAVPALAFSAVVLVGAPAMAQEPGASTAQVTVLDHGVEPRQELRYTFVEGSTEVLETVIDNAVSISLNGVETESLDLSMSLITTTTVTEVFDDGSARVDYVITDWDVSNTGTLSADPDELEAVLSVVEGLGGYWVLDTRGAVLDVGLDLPADVPAELLAQADQAVFDVQALPEEAVGVGAIWETSSRTATAGIELGMQQVTEVTSIDGDVIGLRQEFASAMDPDAGTFALMQVDLTGGAVSELRLDRVSQPAEMETIVTTTMAFDDGQGTTEIVTDTTTSVIATLIE